MSVCYLKADATPPVFVLADALREDGLHHGGTAFNRDLTGTDLAVAVLLSGARTTLTVVDERDACEGLTAAVARAAEELAVLASAGPGPAERAATAEYFPWRSPRTPEGRGNCENHPRVRKAGNLGLGPQGAVCKECPFLSGCPFQEHRKRAEEADHQVMTAFHAVATDFETAANGRSAVLVLSRHAADVFAPAVHVTLGAGEVVDIERYFQSCLCEDLAVNMPFRRGQTLEFLRAVNAISRRVADAATATGVTDVDLGEPGLAPEYGWEAPVMKAFERRPVPPEMFGALFRVYSAAAMGRLKSLTVNPNDGRVVIFVVYDLRRLTVPTVVLDATTTAAGLGRVTGRPCAELTLGPAESDEGPLEAWPGQAVQVPKRFTQRESAKAIAKTVRLFVRAHPGVSFGAVVPENRRREVGALLRKEGVVVSADPKQSEALRRCETVILFGAPAVAWTETAERLLQEGGGAAVREGRDWGLMPWAGAYPDGTPVTMRRRKVNRHPRWRAVDELVIKGRLRRLLADTPRRVLIVTGEDLGLPLARMPADPDGEDEKLLALIWEETEGGAPQVAAGAPAGEINFAKKR